MKRSKGGKLPTTAGKLITLDFGKMNVRFHEESFILAEKTQSAGIANSITGDTLCESFLKILQTMKHILETDRLLLREFSVKDSKNFYELNLNPNVIKYTGDKAFQNINAAENFLNKYTDYQVNGFGRWAVIDKSNEDFLGWCGLKYVEKLDETDIGFRFFEQHWNKGFATESAKACLKYGFEKLNLKTIIGRVMKENIASIKVLENLGLNYECEFDFDGHKGLIYKIENNKPSHNSL